MATIRIQVRRGSASQWTSVNPTLEAGEIGLETDTNKIKFGTGSTVWTALSYLSVGDIPEIAMDAINTAITLGSGLTKSYNDDGNTISISLDTAVVATLSGTQTLTNKTLTSPVINTPTGITKSDVGLANVDNTSDANKPVSTATQTALDLKATSAALASHEADTTSIHGITNTALLATMNYVDTAVGALSSSVDTNFIEVGDRGTMNGVAPLNSSVKIENSYLTADVVLKDETQTLTNKSLTAPAFTGTATGVNMTLSGDLTVNGTTTIINSTAVNVNNQVIFEGATPNEFETTLTTIEPTADRSVSLPDATGTIVLADNTQTLSNKSINLNANTITTTLAQLNTAVSDADVATTAGSETLTNKTLTSPKINEDVILTATATELNILDGATLSTAELNILDGVTASTAELNILDGATLSLTELNYVDGVTSSIQTQIDTKAPSASPTFTGTVTLPSGAVTSTMILDGTILDADINASAAIDWTKLAVSSTVSSTELGYVDGVTSAIQTQLDAKAPLASPTFTGTVTLPANTISQSMMGDNSVGTNEIVELAVTTAKIADLAVTNGKIADLAVTTGKIADLAVTAAKIADLTVTEGKIADSAVTSAKIASLTIVDGDISATAAIDWTKLGISSTVSSTEIGYLDGVTGPIQTQLDGKQATVANVSDVEIGYLDGVTSSIQTQLGNKQAVVANVSDTEIGYLDGVTSAIQTQLDAKLASATAASTYAPLASPALTGTPTATLAVTGTNTTQIATTSFVQQEIGVLTAGAPAALNTLDELAAALGDDASYAASITTALGNKAPLASPTFTGTVTLPAAGIVFTDGTQAKEGVPSRTPIIQKTAAYTLSALTERDSLIEVSSATGVTISIPTDATLNYPIGTSIDILQTGAGQVTLAAVTPGTTTVNATPGLKLRTTWSSATLLKRAANTWVVFGDLTA